MKPTMIDAVLHLVPNAEVVVCGENIQWIVPSEAPVTKDKILSTLSDLVNQYDKLEYHRKRATEYPDFRDYLDGIVKNDPAQIQKYIDDCLAVKTKYPSQS